MHLIYLITAHQNPEQLIRLVERLNMSKVSFLVHFNKRSQDTLFEQVKEGLSAFPNVHLLERNDVYWGTFSLVKAVLRGLQYLRDQDIPFGHVKLLSGQDYPLRPAPALVNHFAKHKANSFLNHFPLPADKWRRGGLDRIDRWHVHVLGRRVELGQGQRSFLSNLSPFGGFAYWCLNHEAVYYTLSYLEQRPDYLNFFRFVRFPDEVFFHTLLVNSPLKHSLIDSELTYTEWRPGDSPSPEELTLSSLPALCASPYLFARKFNQAKDSAVLDEIDRRLLCL